MKTRWVQFTNSKFPFLKETAIPFVFWVATTVSVGKSKLDHSPKTSSPASLRVRMSWVELEFEAGLLGHRFGPEEFPARLRAPAGVTSRAAEAATGDFWLADQIRVVLLWW